MKKKLLFLAASSPHKAQLLYEGFKELPDISADIIYRTENENTYYNDTRTLKEKIFSKIKLPIDPHGQNRKAVEYCAQENPDYLVIVKGNAIKPWSLAKIKKISPQTRLISWSQDDMYAWHNRSLYYTYGLKYYDLVVTQKSYNCDELKLLGARRVLFQNKAYLPRIHQPFDEDSANPTKHRVLFIGSAEKDRFDDMNFLAQNSIEVHVYGSGWDKKYYQDNKHPNLILYCKNIVNKEYSCAITHADISLCFLRKANRDLQTDRTMEIPACKGFMLAERTQEHQNLFQEGCEAEYFSSKEELLSKVQYYLTHPDQRDKIKIAGWKKCLEAKHSYQNRAREILETVDTL